MFPRASVKHVLGQIRQASGGTRQREVDSVSQRRSGPVDVAAVADVDDGDDMSLVVDPVYDAVSSASCAAPVIQRREQLLADAVRLLKQRSGDELVGGSRDRFRQCFGKCQSHCWRCPERVRILPAFTHSCAERLRIVSASSAAVTCSPRASSASDSASLRIVSASRMMARVSSSLSRSSTATSTADGRPWTVTVTRSWWSCTRPTSSDRWVFTSPRGSVVIVKSLTKKTTEVKQQTAHRSARRLTADPPWHGKGTRRAQRSRPASLRAILRTAGTVLTWHFGLERAKGIEPS